MAQIASESGETIRLFSILDPDGDLDGDAEPDLDLLGRLHEAMLRARRFDERLLKLQRQGAVGTFAPVKGQEAAQIGSISCIGEDDWFVPAFRETAAALWRGADMADMLVFTAGWNDGVRLPRDARDLHNAVPVASQLPIAAGIAYAAARRGEDSVTLTYFGDGATSEGDFHEALNFAAVLSAPVVFLCQNNGWAISTPRDRQTASETLAQKAHAYGMPGAQVDGNDVLAMRAATEEAVARAREDKRPTMIEAVTYRMEVHTTADDPTRYRDEDEVEQWAKRDPIARAQKLLTAREALDDDALAELEDRIEKEIDDAWDAAQERIAELEDGPRDAIFDHVFAAPTQELERQRAAFRRSGGES